MLVITQEPLIARVAIGKEKDRKPIDPPPVVQLASQTEQYNNPYHFMKCSLVSEDYDEETGEPELPAKTLAGTSVSSIYRLRDTHGREGGYFIFGDLSVKEEGRFRLLFRLFDRDEREGTMSYRMVDQILSDVFTVYSPKTFPGMASSTPLTRTFSDQGVKLRIRKDSRAQTTKKRGSETVVDSDDLLGGGSKRHYHNRLRNVGGFSSSDQTMAHGTGHGMSSMPRLSIPSSIESRQSNMVLPLPVSHGSWYYGQSYGQSAGQNDAATVTTAPSFDAQMSYTGFHTGYGMNHMQQSLLSITPSPAQTYESGFSSSTGRGMTSPYGIGSGQVGPQSQENTPRTLTTMMSQREGRSMGMGDNTLAGVHSHITEGNGHYDEPGKTWGGG